MAWHLREKRALDANFQPQSWLNIQGTWRCKALMFFSFLVIDRSTSLLPVRCFLGAMFVRIAISFHTFFA